MASGDTIKQGGVVSKEENTSKDVVKQFGEESSLDKVALNNKIVTMRQITKKSKSHVLAKLIRQLKQLNNKTNEKATNIEKNKTNSDSLLKEITALKKVKPDTISRFVLGNTFTFAQLSSKGFQTIECRTLARFANEPKLQKSVSEFRENHPDWKSLAAFLQSQSTGRQIKNNKNTKSKAEKKINIRAKKALISNFLDKKTSEISSDCHDDDRDVKEEDEEGNVSSDDKTFTLKGNRNSTKQTENIDKKRKACNSKSDSVLMKSDEDISCGVNVEDKVAGKVKKTDVNSKEEQKTDAELNSKQMEDVVLNNKETTDVESKDKQSKAVGSVKNKNTAVPKESRKQMIVRRINLDDIESDDIFGAANSVSGDFLMSTLSSDDNRNSENDLFAMGSSHGTNVCEEDMSTNVDNEDNQLSSNFANHSMFLSLNERIDSTPEETTGFGGRRGFGLFGRARHSEYGSRGISSDRDGGNTGYRRGSGGYSRGGGYKRGGGGFNRGEGRGGGFNRGEGRVGGFNRGGGFNYGGRGRGGREGATGEKRMERNDSMISNNNSFTNKNDFHERRSFQKENSNTKNKGVPSGKLHPSWEASRKRKLETSAIKVFQGKKITFGDD